MTASQGGAGTETLRLDGVGVDLDGHRIVDEVSLTVPQGKVVGLLGPNGCGKSTLLRSVYRVLRPASGTIRLHGEDIWHKPIRWVGSRIGVVLQQSPLDFPLSVHEVVLQGRVASKALLEPDSATDREMVAAALRTVGMSELAHRDFHHLSGGERQRVVVAQALASQPDMLVMDEPLNHLDLQYQHGLMRIVKALGMSALVAMHDLNMAARYCDLICLLEHGRVRAIGTPDEVLDPLMIAQVYNVRVERMTHPSDGTPLVVVI